VPRLYFTDHSALRDVLTPATADPGAGDGRAADGGAVESGRLRLRDADAVVTLPARVPGNLPGVVVEAVQRPVRAGPGRCCSPRHPTHFEPSFLDLNGTL